MGERVRLTKAQRAWLKKLVAAEDRGVDLFPAPNYVMTGKLDALGVAEIVPRWTESPVRWPWSNYKLRSTPEGRAALENADEQ